jgi:prephenate dehydratase
MESRPSARSVSLAKPWEYVIYLDFDGSTAEENVKKALAHLNEFAEVKVLGSYAKNQQREDINMLQGM